MNKLQEEFLKRISLEFQDKLPETFQKRFLEGIWTRNQILFFAFFLFLRDSSFYARENKPSVSRQRNYYGHGRKSSLSNFRINSQKMVKGISKVRLITSC